MYENLQINIEKCKNMKKKIQGLQRMTYLEFESFANIKSFGF